MHTVYVVLYMCGLHPVYVYLLLTVWSCCVLLCRPGLVQLLSGGPDEAKASPAGQRPE